MISCSLFHIRPFRTRVRRLCLVLVSDSKLQGGEMEGGGGGGERGEEEECRLLPDRTVSRSGGQIFSSSAGRWEVVVVGVQRG